MVRVVFLLAIVGLALSAPTALQPESLNTTVEAQPVQEQPAQEQGLVDDDDEWADAETIRMTNAMFDLAQQGKLDQFTIPRPDDETTQQTNLAVEGVLVLGKTKPSLDQPVPIANTQKIPTVEKKTTKVDSAAKVMNLNTKKGQISTKIPLTKKAENKAENDAETAPPSPPQQDPQPVKTTTAATGPRIDIVSVCVGVDYCDTAKRNFEKYANSNGYNLHFLTHVEGSDPARSHHWQKILAMQHVLQDQSVDYVFWMDADSLFMNRGTRLETLIPSQDVNLVMSGDFNSVINNGHILFKNSNWSRTFLQEWYKIYPSPKPWHDQSAMILLLNDNSDSCKADVCGEGGHNTCSSPCAHGISDKYHEKVKLLPASAMNSYVSDFKSGDFILHFAGVSSKKKPTLMESYASKIVDKASLLNYLTQNNL